MTDQTDRFRELVESNLGCAVILAGSGSDEKHIEKIVWGGEKKDGGLRSYGIPHEVRIQSAHNDPTAVLALVKHYNSMRGSLVYVTVAGGVDALSGIVARHSIRPVISCPPDVPNESCLGNPDLSSNMYVRRPANVAKAVAQLFSNINPRYAEQLRIDLREKATELDMKDRELRRKLSWLSEPWLPGSEEQ